MSSPLLWRPYPVFHAETVQQVLAESHNKMQQVLAESQNKIQVLAESQNKISLRL